MEEAAFFAVISFAAVAAIFGGFFLAENPATSAISRVFVAVFVVT